MRIPNSKLHRVRVGPNGAGKSTPLAAPAGGLPAAQGTIERRGRVALAPHELDGGGRFYTVAPLPAPEPGYEVRVTIDGGARFPLSTSRGLSSGRPGRRVTFDSASRGQAR